MSDEHEHVFGGILRAPACLKQSDSLEKNMRRGFH